MNPVRPAFPESTAPSPGLMTSLGLAESGGDVSATWVSRAFLLIAALWPLVLLAKICISALYGAPFHHIASPWQSILLAAMLLADGALMIAPRQSRFRALMPHVQMWLMLPMAFLSGLTFSLWCNVTAPSLHFIVPEFAVALLAVCIFGDRRLLGLSYFLGVLLVSVMQQGGWMQAGLAVSCVSVMLIATVRQARVDRDQAMLRYRQELRAQRSDRLLHEYERSGRGWFWETDRQGLLVYLSKTLATTLGRPVEQLIGQPFTDLVGPGNRPHGDGERTLGFHLSARSGFTEVAVQAAMMNEERWWSISGQPVFNEYGQFQGFRGSGTDLTEIKRSQAEVARLAQFDSLTGLANRVQIMQALEHSIKSINGQMGECTLMMLDLDRFKSVNDTLGHPAGDALLRQVSERLLRVVGNQGLVGRQGGDEFKILLVGRQDPAVLGHLAQAIISTISQPYKIEDTSVVIGVSIGISHCPHDGVTTDALIRNADLALYAAKGNGRGVYRFYSSDMHADAEDRRRLEEDLRDALATDALHLVYQPVVSSVTEQITGYEALLRWQHPRRGLIGPDIFIPIAEDTGLIAQIGDWVIRTACKDAAQWVGSTRVAVNVSPIQFANPSFPSTIMNALASTQLSPERLELEITESVFLNDNADTDSMFARLKALGVRLALDDFGTGYSSLGYLKKAPFDKIKIDQSFVRGAAIKGNRNSAIIKAIVSLAEALGMDTTAEGAETHDELDLIRQLGCSHVQGYVYGRPMGAAEVLERQLSAGTAAKVEGFKSSRPERKSMLRTVAVHNDGDIYSARIRNISATGALVEGLWDVPEGTTFIIELADNYFADAVAHWSKDDRMGVEFREAVDLSRLKTTTRRLLAS
ncbi:bifunctional diguanylate cyclase/phosphodiesterase [Sphingobium sp. CFD-1]|uniref:putative bifunctional diguanylate cyclase/phosphodiesterase n=1 Tax=Sphingobium sp. CFD-1 TaxID=2878545 RepID=UPI00214ABF86|nr:GGDEF and EAL domain-containing protein [Sphingobium sp. CFD-1]